jgi:hypothetical protein
MLYIITTDEQINFLIVLVEILQYFFYFVEKSR